MKEQDFDHIGRRLYDHEADPPKDGWDKIAGALETPKKPGTFSWLKKSLWIPLALLVPLALWLTFWEQAQNDPFRMASLFADSAKTQGSADDGLHVTQTELRGSAQTLSVHPQDVNIKPSPVGKAEDVQNHAPATLPQKTIHDTGRKPTRRLSAAVSADQKHELSSVAMKKQLETGEHNQADDAAITPPYQEGQRLGADGIKGEVVGHGAKTLHAMTPDVSVAQNMDKQAKAVTKAPLVEKHPVPDTTASAIQAEPTKEKKGRGDWRLNLSFTPQYLAKSVRPIANDEVLVTKIETDKGNFSDRIGLGFAIGAGRSVAKDLYVDAHLTFSQSRQTTFFSYSTGKVDTLLAVEQPDRSVRVIPVYQETDRETMSEYAYGGIKVVTTYYLLPISGGRLNLQVGAGINYLLSADIKERVAGRWVALDDSDLSRLNCALTIGAGYSIDLNRQWALMINPALTYHLRQVRNGQLPYRLNQRPFGVNIMLSRTL